MNARTKATGATPADDLARARAALFACDPGAPRGEWVRVGMAAKAAGLELADFTEWSARGANFTGARDCLDAWKSFKDGGGVTAATLFHLAREAGWIEAQPERKSGAAQHWQGAPAAPADHPYIARKGGIPDGLRLVNWPLEGWGPAKGKSLQGWLMVPAKDAAGTVQNVQLIGPNGEKVNGAGPMAGTFTLGQIEAGKRAFVVEGIGHAWTCRKATGAAAVVAFGKGRLQEAAELVKRRGGLPVVVADRGAEAEAERAAQAVGGAWVKMPDDLPAKADVNDLEKRDGIEAARAALSVQIEAKAEVQAEPGKASGMDGLRLVMDKRNRPFWNAANAVEILARHEAWQGVLGYNQFTRRRVIMRPIPGTRTGGGRNLEDDDATAVVAWFNRNGFPKATATVTLAAMHAVAKRNSFDPLQDYLSSLTWDGVPRIAEWLTTYCGVAPTEYTREVGRRWLISAVARAFKPGCKADHMLVLEGEQGARKSSALAALAGEEWFSDALPPMNTKDASQYLRGRWIVEVAELEAMRREMDAVKAFISRQVESYRPAYGKEDVDEPRRCIFAGTTNKDAWLRDGTGGRRFWPVKVGQIDLDAIKRDRGQLWAEAVAAFKAKEIWWLEGEAEAEAKAQQAERMESDPWLEAMPELLAGKSEISIKELLGAIGLMPQDQERKHSDRMADLLRRLGWVRGARITAGKHKGQITYRRPD